MLATYTIISFLSPSHRCGCFNFPSNLPTFGSITEVYGKKTACYVVTACYVPAVIISFINNGLLAAADNHHIYDFC